MEMYSLLLPLATYICGARQQSIFPVIHKVDNVRIFIQLLMRIKWKWLLISGINYNTNLHFS